MFLHFTQRKVEFTFFKLINLNVQVLLKVSNFNILMTIVYYFGIYQDILVVKDYLDSCILLYKHEIIYEQIDVFMLIQSKLLNATFFISTRKYLRIKNLYYKTTLFI